MNKKYYITTAIPYVNAKPHIGHALEFVQADAFARFQRLTKKDVFFASGSDENSLKNVQAAEKENLKTEVLVKKYADNFENLKDSLNLTFDVFNRTATEAHFRGAQKLWESCKKEDIYKKTYKGLYCVGCEQFYLKKELVGGKCPEHLTIPEEVEEENYFFKLTNYQKFLENLIKSDKLKIIPKTRKNEVLSFIKGGLEDFSISRSKARARDWGVPVPKDPDQIMYVWFDALTTYLTALGYGSDEKLFEKYWLNGENKTHIIGKGIIRFHAVYWPAMLASARLPLPTVEFVHSYATVEGQKISKSLGNTIDPEELVKKYGADVVRYYLLREIPSYNDGDFSERRLIEIYNGELANGLGNLVARVAKLAHTTGINTGEDPTKDYKLHKEVAEFTDEFKFDEAVKFLWEQISHADKYLNEKEPWKLEGEKKNTVINESVINVLEIAYNLQPFLPETAKKIADQFTGEIKSQTPLFPRI